MEAVNPHLERMKPLLDAVSVIPTVEMPFRKNSPTG